MKSAASVAQDSNICAIAGKGFPWGRGVPGGPSDRESLPPAATDPSSN
jgi:hypothetical protein